MLIQNLVPAPESATRLGAVSADDERNSSPWVRLQARFDCPPQRLFDLLTDYSSMPRNIYAVERAEVLWRRGAELHVRFTMKLPRPIGRVSWTNAITHRCEAECSRLEWSLVGGDLRANEGRIELRPIAEAGQLATQVDYAAAISARGGLPRVVERAVACWLLPRVLERLRGALPPSRPWRKSPVARAAGQPRLRGRFESSNTPLLSPLAPSIRIRRARSASSVRLSPGAAGDARSERREPELRGRG